MTPPLPQLDEPQHPGGRLQPSDSGGGSQRRNQDNHGYEDFYKFSHFYFDITAVAQVLYRIVYLGQSVKQAVDARRLHHQLIPMEILYEDGVTQWMVEGLEKIGHHTRKFSLGGSIVQAVLVDSQTGAITANADFRKDGSVDGF